MNKFEKILIVCLLVFGLLYSAYVTIYTNDFYVGLVLALVTLGFSATIYILDKKINYRIIIYIWIAIVLIAIIALLLRLSFSAMEIFIV
ncbi:MAG: hypothetical protein JW700_00025 [Candidatus Aenigmarchaeota archaeon]|nr:hypothetical protein [Candidatus Aenigmarchaeota archaeon]